MKFFCFLLGAAVGVFGTWFYLQRNHSPQASMETTRERVAAGAERFKEGVSEKVRGLSFNSDEIKDELARTGQVVRKKGRELGAVVADKAADARITAAIKAKYVAEPNVSALSISVSTTDGVVTLSGSANSPEEIAKAMRIALDVEGAREVISTIQLKSAK